jgi:predicted O-methyltransferase YrrM
MKALKAFLKTRIPIIKNYSKLVTEKRRLERELARWKKGIFPPGHYYSPLLMQKDIPEKILVDYNSGVPGVDLNEEYQVLLLDKLKSFYQEDLFPILKREPFRYYFDNDYFGYSDGIFLCSLIREFKPKKIIEIGSGFSSALMLDTNEIFFQKKMQLTFIEPYPEERLMNLIGATENCTIVKDFVQNVPPDIWDDLEENDILFIDSSHVSKYSSDVNHLFFNIIPNLKAGVIIHIHDIFFPFEYPVEWLKQERSWSETYLLRSFLQFNSHFEIILFTSFLEGKYRMWFEENMPLCLKTHKTITIDGKQEKILTTGQGIYIRRKEEKSGA